MQDVLLDRKTLARGYFKKSQVEQLLSENVRSGAYSKELFSLSVENYGIESSWSMRHLCFQKPARVRLPAPPGSGMST